MTETQLLPEINIGAIGHVDHGKTTLTYALTGKWTMLHSEELKRGITIKLGYADADICECPAGHLTSEKECSIHKKKTKLIRKVSFVDAPGHETLMAVMISGAAIMDCAMLVIAANEPCPQPQTQEHLMALKILGIKHIIVVQNKIDLITKAKALENYRVISEFIKKTLGFEVPIIPVSAQKRVNIDMLLEAIQEICPTPKRDTAKDPLMLVVRSFDINRPGADIKKLHGGVLGGAISQGLFKRGDSIELRPGLKTEKKGVTFWEPIKTTIASMVSGSTIVTEKGPGGTVAIATTLDPGLTKGDAFVGNILGLEGKMPEAKTHITLEAHLFEYVIGTKEHDKIVPIKPGEPIMISIGTATTLGIAQEVSKTTKLSLKKPVVAQSGDKISLSRQVKGRWRLIGYGIIK